MTTVSIDDPQFQSAVHACAVALKRMAEYEIDPSLSHRIHELGARKEYLNQVEHNELLAMVDFAHKRTVEKLEAQTALGRLRLALPGLLTDA